MDLESFKRWHWVVIGLLVGILWAGVRLFYGYSFETESREDGQSQFQLALLATKENPALSPSSDGKLYLTDIRVYPPIIDDGPDVSGGHRSVAPPRRQPATIRWPWGKVPATAKANAASAPSREARIITDVPLPKSPGAARQVNWVTGVVHCQPLLWNSKTRRFGFDPQVREIAFRYKAPIPFTPDPPFDYVAHPQYFAGLKPAPLPGYSSPGFKEYPNVQAYLDELNRKYGSGAVPYRYAWWESRRIIPVAYPLAGLLIIGGVWPTILSLMIGAGLGRKKVAADEYDLARFKGSGKAAMPKPAAGLTAEDHRRLAELEATMERELQPALAHASATVASAAPEAPIRALTATQADEPKASIDQTKPHKTFGASGGDFYPTEIHKPSEVNADS